MLANAITSTPNPQKQLYCICEDIILFSHNALPVDIVNLSPCNHEEADTHLFLHVADAVSKGHKYIMVRAKDTDVVILAVIIYHKLNNLTKLWVSFGAGNNLCYIAVHEMAELLGPLMSKALTVFHAFTGCDVVSCFASKQTSSTWDTCLVYPVITDIFVQLSSSPGEITK